MIAEDYSVKHYMQEIKPMVKDFHSETEVLKRFEAQLHTLREEMIRCDDNFKIYQAWQDGIGVELFGSYTKEELLDLHGHPSATIKVESNCFRIMDSNETIVEFFYCSHQVYTPVRTHLSINHCLRC